MAGYWNRDLNEPFTAYCPEHLPAERPAAWQAITARYRYVPYSFVDYLRTTFGGRDNLRAYLRNESPYGDRETVREHARRMIAPVTPDGYAYTPWLVGAPCATCGTDC
jgi:hypothetical protein